MIKNITIQKIETCNEDDSIIEVAKKLQSINDRHIFIVDKDQKPAGIISAVDISNRIVAEGKNPKEMKASQVMNSPVESAELNKESEFALKIMMERNTLHCPVVDNGKLVGCVSYNDVFQHVGSKITGGK